MSCLLSFPSSVIDLRDDGVSEVVSIRFHVTPESEDYVEIAFNRFALPTIFTELLRSARLEGQKGPDLAHFDSLLVIEGHATRPLPDGGVELSLHLRTDDGLRTMPIPLSADYARQIAGEITQWLDRG